MSSVMTTGVALFLVWLFGLGAAHKFRSPAYYRGLLSSYFGGVSVASAGVLPIAFGEAALAVGMLVPQSRPPALAGAIVLLLCYAGVMAVQIKRGRDDLACGCAGPASTLSVSSALVWRNVVCAALGLFALVGGAQELPPLGYGLALTIAGFLVIVYVCSEQLIANAQLMAGDV